MTTIAYRDGVLAGDTQSTANGMRVSNDRKVFRIGRLLVGACGSGALCERFPQFVRGGMQGISPFHGDTDGNGVVITPHGTIVCWGKNGPSVYNWPYFAMGSGDQIATGAMEMGASAVEAVAAAMRVDIHSGGEIETVSLHDGVRLPPRLLSWRESEGRPTLRADRPPTSTTTDYLSSLVVLGFGT